MAKGTIVCAECGRQHTVIGSPTVVARQKFCSRACMALSFRGRIPCLMDALRDRLAARVDKRADGCWVYTGQNNGNYGQIEYRRRTYLAHRAAYMVHKGEIPNGACVCHACDNRLCVNPSHLWLGSYSDNARDMVEKGRGNAYTPPRKLTNEDVENIKLEHRNGSSQSTIASKYSVSQCHVSFIVTGKRRTKPSLLALSPAKQDDCPTL